MAGRTSQSSETQSTGEDPDAEAVWAGTPVMVNAMDHAAGPEGMNEALRRLGYDEFRLDHREAIETLFAQKRLLPVAPTGGCKSLTYQLPACLQSGTTMVISPLIAMMHPMFGQLPCRTTTLAVEPTTVTTTVPTRSNRGGGNRTHNRWFWKPVLCRLSYTPLAIHDRRGARPA